MDYFSLFYFCNRLYVDRYIQSGVKKIAFHDYFMKNCKIFLIEFNKYSYATKNQ